MWNGVLRTLQEKQPCVSVIFLILHFLWIRASTNQTNTLSKLGDDYSFQLLCQSSACLTLLDSSVKNMCCGHYRKIVADITFWEHVKNQLKMSQE